MGKSWQWKKASLAAFAATVGVVTVLGVEAAVAQVPGAVPPMPPADGSAATGEGLMTMGKFGEDYFLNVAVGTAFTFGKISFGVQAPLKIRVIDEKPEDEHWYREEDWDEVSDWTKIMRYFQYGAPKDPFYLRAGELVAATIGHGTIVNRYYNTLELDTYHTGLWTNVNIEDGGVEFMTNDVMRWNLVATRGYLRPFNLALEEPDPLLTKLATGVTFAADFTAPDLTVSGGSSQPVLVESAPWLLGFDAEYEAVRSETYSLTPYMDFNISHVGTTGAGYHAGVLNELAALSSSFLLRLEYRLVSARYGVGYFNSLYDIERKSFLPLPQDGPGGPGAVPKYTYVHTADGLEARHGAYGELFANVLGLVGVGGIYEDYQGADNASVTLRGDLPAIAGVKLSAYYTRRNFDDLSGVFDLKDAFLVGEGRVQLSGPFFLYGLYASTWREVDPKPPAVQPELKRESSSQVGAGVAFAF